jgi:tRNA-modifying protein YgfZ
MQTMQASCRHNGRMERKDLFDVVSVRGPEALPFLHSQFAADLNPVPQESLRWAALLNAQGRVLTVVAAIRHGDGDWSLLVPYGRGAELVETLSRFVFRRKVKLAVEADRHVTASGDGLDAGIDGLRLHVSGDAAAPVLDLAAAEAFAQAGLALIAPAAAGRHLAHSLKLERFAAVSVSKGCYPGQEIVARTHFLGRNKRVLARLALPSDAAVAAGSTLRAADGAEIGEVAMSAGRTALAVLTAPIPVGDTLRTGPDGPVVTVVEIPQSGG